MAACRFTSDYGQLALLVMAEFGRTGLEHLAVAARASPAEMSRRILAGSTVGQGEQAHQLRCLTRAMAAPDGDPLALRRAVRDAWQQGHGDGVVALLEFNAVVLRRLVDHRRLPPREMARTEPAPLMAVELGPVT